jgi:hypothetical protein
VTASDVTFSPNPFNTQSIVSFAVTRDDVAVLEVFTATGVKVMELFRGAVQANRRYELSIGGTELADGVYIYRFTTSAGTQTGNLVHVR